jgi:protocatechuate 3,4-dioxygenase beta subunit
MRRSRSFLLFLLLLGLLPAVSATVEIPVRGRVLDEVGRPVAGATVELLPVLSAPAEAQLWREGKTSPDPVARAASGADGRFRIAAPDLGLWQVRVEAQGFVPVEIGLLPLSEARELEPAVLKPDVGLQVRVLDPKGLPLAGARVWAVGREREEEGRSWNFWHPAWRWGSSDAAGTATLPRSEEEELRLSAFVSGHPVLDALLFPDQAAIELRAVAGCPRRVEVRDPAGKPVAGAAVLSDSFSASRGWVLGATAADGGLTIFAPCERRARLGVEASDGGHADAVLEPGASGQPAVQIALLPAIRWDGRVVTAEGTEPVAGALVWSENDPGAAVRTDARGRYSLSVSRTTSVYAFSAVIAGRSVECHGQVFAPGATQVQAAGPTLSMATGSHVEGMVVDGSGAPVAGVRVQGGYGSWSAADPQTLSDDEGRFHLETQPQQRLSYYKLLAVREGYAPSIVEIGKPGLDLSHLMIVLAPGRRIVGRIVDGESRPVAGAELILRGALFASTDFPVRYSFRPKDDPSLPGVIRSDVQGRFTIANLQAGTYDLGVLAPGFALAARLDLAVPEGEGTIDLGEVVLSPGYDLEGFVVDPQGRPIAGARVGLWETGWFESEVGELPFPEQGVRTDRDGRFLLRHLTTEHPISVGARHPGYVGYGWSAQHRIELPAAEPLRLVLQPTIWVTGRVVDEQGELVGPARLELVRVEGPAAAPQDWGSRDTHQDGTFALSFTEPEKMVLQAKARGHLPSAAVSLASVTDRRNVVLQVRTGEILEGRLTDLEGRPLAGAWIKVLRGGDQVQDPTQPTAVAVTDAAGLYRLTGLRAGSCNLGIQYRSFNGTVTAVLQPGINQGDIQMPTSR